MAANTVGLLDDDPPSSGKAGALRLRVVSEHQRLRHELLELQEECARGSGRPSEGLVERLLAGIGHLRAHMRAEEVYLLPVLAGVDAWGPVRSAAIRAEHERQRARLSDLAAAVARPSFGLAELRERLEVLVREVQEDMDREEAELLPLDLARDDVGSGDLLTV